MRFAPLLCLAWLIAGCSPSGGGDVPPRAAADTAAPAKAAGTEEFSSPELEPAGEYLAEPRFAAADLARGEVLSYACRACHRLDEEVENPLGPNLEGVFGRRAATREDFDYSAALRQSGIVWTPAALDAWLEEPAGFIPGNNMAFTGFRSAEDRRDLIAYLLHHLRRDE